MNEEQGVDHTVGVGHNLQVVEPPLLLVEDPDPVEEPEGKDEDEQEDGQGGPVEVDPGHGGPGPSIEERPRAQE